MTEKEEQRLAFYRKQIKKGRVSAKNSTRIFAGIADGVLAWLLGMLFFSGLIQIVIHGDLPNQMDVDVAALKTESTASGLVLYEHDGSVESQDTRKERYIRKVVSYDATSEASDELYHYYCLYASTSKEAWEVSAFNERILKAGEEGSYFEVVAADKEAVLVDSTKDWVEAYLNGDRTAEAINAYQGLGDFYISAHNAAWNEFCKASPYVDILSSYAQKATLFYLSIGYVHIVSYLLSGILLYYVVPLIKKKGTTLSKKALRLEPRMKDGEAIRWPAILLKGSIEILLGAWAIPLTGLFVYGFDSLTVPFIASGNFVVQLSTLFIAGIALTMASLMFALIRKDNRSLSDLAASTWVTTSDIEKIRNAQAELRLTEKKGEDDGR